MAKEILTVEINRIQLEISNTNLGVVELTSLAEQVGKYMQAVRDEGEIDTLKQALRAALFFAAQAYLNGQSAGGRQKEEEARLDGLITKLKRELEPPHK